MAAIDIGTSPANGNTVTGASGETTLDLANPANDTGTLTSFEVWMANEATSSVKVGTFYGSGTSWTLRDYEDLGAVAAGSKQTFTGKSCSVSANDCIGGKPNSGNFEANSTGGSGILYYSGDSFTGGAKTYTLWSGAKGSIYATGETAAAGWTTAKLGSIASASIIKVAGIAVASVKKVAGVAVQ